PARRWPLERWSAVGRALSKRGGAQLVIVGTASDGGSELSQQLPGALNLTGRTALAQLAAVLEQCELFIGADSGVMHVAAAAGVPLVALFGSTNAKAWGPWRPDGKPCVVLESQDRKSTRLNSSHVAISYAVFCLKKKKTKKIKTV